MSDFVTQNSVRLPLSPAPDGRERWIEAKASLSYGEEQDLRAAGVRIDADPGGLPRVAMDVARLQPARLEMWLLDWNLTDQDGKTVPLTPQNIRHLHPRTAAEIEAVLDAHAEAALAGKAPLPTGSA